jgi:hypothetical protein
MTSSPLPTLHRSAALGEKRTSRCDAARLHRRASSVVIHVSVFSQSAHSAGALHVEPVRAAAAMVDAARSTRLALRRTPLVHLPRHLFRIAHCGSVLCSPAPHVRPARAALDVLRARVPRTCARCTDAASRAALAVQAAYGIATKTVRAPRHKRMRDACAYAQRGGARTPPSGSDAWHDGTRARVRPRRSTRRCRGAMCLGLVR